VITIARIESELDYWFSADPPACSVLWLIGSPSDLVPALARLAGQLGHAELRAAACAPGTQPPPFPAAAGQHELLRAELGFTGSAIEDAPGPLLRHPSSKGSVCVVISAGPAADGIWRTLADADGLRVCAGLFPSGSTDPGHWIYSAMRMVMVAGTTALNRGPASGAQDALLHAFLADTLQHGGVAAIKGALDLCGPGIALTGRPAAIDKAQHAFPTAAEAEDIQVRHSVELAGPWSAPGYRPYKRSPASGRWIPLSNSDTH
jgi:hypothetical protein